jgi:hypothetical protein
VSVGIPFYLKKKLMGGCALPGGDMQKPKTAKMWAGKNKNRPVSGLFTKTTYVQVMNFIPVKVSTLYFSFIIFLYSLYVNTTWHY